MRYEIIDLKNPKIIFGEGINIETFIQKIEFKIPLNHFTRYVNDINKNIQKDSIKKEKNNNKEFRNPLYKERWEKLKHKDKQRYNNEYYEAKKNIILKSLLLLNICFFIIIQ